MAIFMSAVMPCRRAASSACFSAGGGEICGRGGQRARVARHQAQQPPQQQQQRVISTRHGRTNKGTACQHSPSPTCGSRSAMSAAADSHCLRLEQKTSTEWPPNVASATRGTRRSASRLQGGRQAARESMALQAEATAVAARGGMHTLAWASMHERVLHGLTKPPAGPRTWTQRAPPPAALAAAARPPAPPAVPPAPAVGGRQSARVGDAETQHRYSRDALLTAAGQSATCSSTRQLQGSRLAIPRRRQLGKPPNPLEGIPPRLACAPTFSYTLPRKTACSVSGTGRKFVRNNSARSQARSASRPPTAKGWGGRETGQVGIGGKGFWARLAARFQPSPSTAVQHGKAWRPWPAHKWRHPGGLTGGAHADDLDVLGCRREHQLAAGQGERRSHGHR